MLADKKWKWMVVIALVVGYFVWLHSSFYFADPDAFYHARLSRLLMEKGIKIDFIWLPFSALADYYTDHHLLFHLAVAPLALFLSPWLALKVASVFWSVVFILVFYLFLRVEKVPFASLAVFLLLINFPFIFRLSLGKSLPLVLIFLLLGFYFFKQGEKLPTFAVSFILVWLYGGWPLLFLMFISYWLLVKVKKWVVKKQANTSTSLPLLSAAAGFLAGLVVNPYFPQNLKFYLQQVWYIALVNYQDKIGVGVEWFPYQIDKLVKDLGWVAIAAVVALAGISLLIEKISLDTVWYWCWSLLFLALTLKSQRYVEYLVPWLVLFIFYVGRDVKVGTMISKLRQIIFSSSWQRYFVWLFLLLFAGHLVFFSGRDLYQLKQHLSQGFRVDQYKAVAEFLQKNTQPGEVIFHSDWGIFPLLWYYNQYNRYIVGLDPTFLYNKDRRRYWQWVYVTAGRVKEVTPIVKKSFTASYALVDQRHPQMLANFLVANWQIIYQDEQATVLKSP